MHKYCSYSDPIYTLDPVEIEEGGGEGEVMGAEGLSFYRRALRTG